jgi:hypothetical protein
MYLIGFHDGNDDQEEGSSTARGAGHDIMEWSWLGTLYSSGGGGINGAAPEWNHFSTDKQKHTETQPAARQWSDLYSCVWRWAGCPSVTPKNTPSSMF